LSTHLDIETHLRCQADLSCSATAPALNVRRPKVHDESRTIYDPDDPMGKMFLNILATFAEFEVDLIRMRKREGMAVARAQGKLKGRQPKLSVQQQRELKRMHDTGGYSIADLGELLSVSRQTVYRTINCVIAEQTEARLPARRS